MARLDNPNDPYAAPHAPKERGGPLLRILIVALLLGAAGAGWAHFSSQPAQPLAPPQEAAADQPIRVADAADSNQTPEGAPAPQPDAAAPTPATPDGL